MPRAINKIKNTPNNYKLASCNNRVDVYLELNATLRATQLKSRSSIINRVHYDINDNRNSQSRSDRGDTYIVGTTFDKG